MFREGFRDDALGHYHLRASLLWPVVTSDGRRMDGCNPPVAPRRPPFTCLQTLTQPLECTFELSWPHQSHLDWSGGTARTPPLLCTPLAASHPVACHQGVLTQAAPVPPPPQWRAACSHRHTSRKCTVQSDICRCHTASRVKPSCTRHVALLLVLTWSASTASCWPVAGTKIYQG